MGDRARLGTRDDGHGGTGPASAWRVPPTTTPGDGQLRLGLEADLLRDLGPGPARRVTGPRAAPGAGPGTRPPGRRGTPTEPPSFRAPHRGDPIGASSDGVPEEADLVQDTDPSGSPKGSRTKACRRSSVASPTASATCQRSLPASGKSRPRRGF